MKIKLLRDARVEHKEGEVVETSPSFAKLLVESGMAVVEEAKEEAKEQPKKTTKKK